MSTDLAKAQDELDQLDTAIADRIRLLTDALGERVRVRVSVDVGDGRTLTFGKRSGAWCFIVARRDGNQCPLVSCSRDERLEMVEGGHLERLIDSAPQLIVEMVPPRRVAVTKLDALITRTRT